jgi:hypothetical protein
VFVEIIQPTPTSLVDFGMVAVGIDQSAYSVEQASEFSERVASFAEGLSRKGKVCSVQLPALQGEPIPILPTQEIGLRIKRRVQP